ncbi:uncharacterized protein N7483_003100 [Penicillium malachiteum]|uniref:uncharacterized protein n=1 Tax=Penicillium malachiteum TaxID=1324776 RepID=UPI002546B9E2|nr:uncharacterized protein N7483_003100 [Penicillium malachiteum]KAJ5728592.1 hypothetical protein N7483_003100 [Penicillium malachiteum]
MTYADGVESELEVVFSPYSNCAQTRDSASIVNTNWVLSWHCQSLKSQATYYRVSKVSDNEKRSGSLVPRRVPLTPTNALGTVPLTIDAMTRVALTTLTSYLPAVMFGTIFSDLNLPSETEIMWESSDLSFDGIMLAGILMDVAAGLAGIPPEIALREIQVCILNTAAQSIDASRIFFWLSSTQA